jgi:CRP-like cAMP-binding protein
VAGLQKLLDQRTRELAGAPEQQRATSEILPVMSSSSSNLTPAFETLLANVTRLCQAEFGNLELREGDSFRMAALHGAPPAYVEWRGRQPVIRVSDFPHLPLAPVARTKAVQHVPDLTMDQAYIERAPPIVPLVESVGARSLLSVPILKEGEVIGAIALYRQEVEPFADNQIALVKNFASQAVIAIDSARQIKELSQDLFANARTISLAADQILFSAGEEGDGCYRIDEGLLKASVSEPAGDERILSMLGPGSVVGELSMIDGAPRSASVVALRESKLSFVSRAAFEVFGRSRLELYRHLTILLANRARHQRYLGRHKLSLDQGTGYDLSGRRKLNMIRFVPTLAMAVLFIAIAFPSARAEVSTQPEPAASKTNFTASPITPGFWQFSSIGNLSNDDVAQGCRDYITFQFQDGYYFMLGMKKNRLEPTEPRLSTATVHEVGRCTFDRQSQSEHCDVAVTDETGAINQGFMDIRYSTENSALKMSIKATITGGLNVGKTESFERFPVKCPDNVIHDLMTPGKQ